jgi:hypothetical protein
MIKASGLISLDSYSENGERGRISYHWFVSSPKSSNTG